MALTRFGEIEIDTKGATSLPGVYAAGDATTVPFKQIIISMGQVPPPPWVRLITSFATRRRKHKLPRPMP